MEERHGLKFLEGDTSGDERHTSHIQMTGTKSQNRKIGQGIHINGFRNHQQVRVRNSLGLVWVCAYLEFEFVLERAHFLAQTVERGVRQRGEVDGGEHHRPR